jgi:ABC-2 type transport system permease protein
LEDKTQRVTEVVLSSMSATRFFAGKILGIGAVGLTQYLAWAVMAAAAAGLGLMSALKGPVLQQLPALQPETYGYFILFYVLGFLLYAGLFAAVGAMSTTDQEAQQLMQPLVFMLVIPLLLIIFVFQNPNAPLAVAMSLVPFFSPLVMFMRLNISAPPLWQLATSLVLLVLSVGLVIFLSGRIFRVGILMTGKRASLAEAWRWLREA